MAPRRLRALLALSALSVACTTSDGDASPPSSSSSSASGATSTGSSTSSSTGAGGAGGAAPIDKAKDCASEFGTGLTNSFGRVDGTVLAVVKPTDTQCPMPNDDHVILEVTMQGAVYRMVINVLSTGADPDVRFLELDHAMVGAPWAEGWHTDAALDYAGDLGLHSGFAFAPVPMAKLSNRIADDITLGDKVSVFCTSSGGASSHLIHRNGQKHDGAVVLHPDGAPRWLLFHFADQSF
ncbi:MAG: hypothetical protein U0414_32930 [Polyangiaceae bacterium]